MRPLSPTIPDLELAPREIPLPRPDAADHSLCTIHSDFGPALTVWATPTERLDHSTSIQVQLRLAPDAPVVIGRANGGEVPYLDPTYIPSPIVPGSGKTILHHGGAQQDTYVSRGHFMLRAHPLGIVLVNGVPRRGGGIRPPRNWTQLVLPQARMLLPEEELLIERATQVTISLPNGARLTIEAG